MARSTVIKAEGPQRVEALGVRAFRLDDVVREAQARISAAQTQAERTLVDARADADRVRGAAREQGFASGYQEGLLKGQEAGRAEALATATKEFTTAQDSLVSMFNSALEQIAARRAEWEASARQDLVDLALAMARRVVRCV